MMMQSLRSTYHPQPRKRRWISSFSIKLVSSLSSSSSSSPSSYDPVGLLRQPVPKQQCRFLSGKNTDRTSQQQQHPTINEQLSSIPNLITLSRLASTPLLCYWVIHDEPNLAIGGCLLAGLSDVLDGYIAKHHGQKTVLGTYLDPFADKFFINSLGISLWYSGILPTPLVALWATKDLLLLGGMGWYLYREQKTINFFSNSIHTQPLTVTPSTLGKVNTGLQFATLGVGILTPVLVPSEVLHPSLLEGLCWGTGATSILTTLSYASSGKGFTYSPPANPPKNNSQ